MTSHVPTHESYLGRKYFSALDLFRFFSIAAVLWHHSESVETPFTALSNGFLGVDFFFVISGFLIVTLLLRERDRTGRISMKGFYLRRSLRIFPIYYGLIGVLAILFSLRPERPAAVAFFAGLPYQLTYLSNFLLTSSILFFTWSLSSEEQFYLVWPPIERWFPRAVIPILVAVLAINQAINFGLLDEQLGEWKKLSILQITFTPICLGVFAAHLLHSPRGFAAVAPVLGRTWMPLVMMALTLAACSIPGDLSGWPRLLIQAVMTLFLASSVVREDHAFNRLFGLGLVRRIGVISYGMYLYHMFVVYVVEALMKRVPLPRAIVPFLLTMVLTAIIAELSFRFYETPFLRLKDRLGQGLQRREARGRAVVREGRLPETEDAATPT